MQFIGRDQVAAPKLRDAKLSKDQLCSTYQQVIDGVTNLYKYVINMFRAIFCEILVFFSQSTKYEEKNYYHIALDIMQHFELAFYQLCFSSLRHCFAGSKSLATADDIYHRGDYFSWNLI